MINSIRILCWVTILALAGLGLGPLAPDIFARGRSFPIEVTGTILNVDRTNCRCTLRVDEPARVLRMGLRSDCKFLKNGAPAKMEILKKGAYVKVSYFATIFTGNLAVEIELNPKPELAHGIIESIDPAKRLLTLRVNNSCYLVVRCAANARFVRYGRLTAPTSFKEGMLVEVSYYSFEFESKYAVKVEVRPTFRSKSQGYD